MYTKSAANSKTIIGILLFVAAWLKDKFGIQITEGEVEAIVGNVVAGAGVVLGIYGRWTAKQPLSVMGGFKGKSGGLPVMVLGMVVLLGGCAATPTARWAQAREALTTTESVLVTLARQGKLSDERIVELDKYVQSARIALKTAEAQLPDGGDTFESYLEIVRALLTKLAEFEAEQNRKAKNGSHTNSQHDRGGGVGDQFGNHPRRVVEWRREIDRRTVETDSSTSRCSGRRLGRYRGTGKVAA